MLFGYRPAVLAAVSVAVFALVNAATAPAKCPYTLVDQYQYFCNATGYVEDPYFLGDNATALTAIDCFKTCKHTKGCKSFEFAYEAQTCRLYSLYLDDMDFNQTINTLPAINSDRDCYTTNCDEIEACRAVEGRCNSAYFGGFEGPSGTWDRYACNYGYTAQKFDFQFEDFILSGTMGPCEAVDQCIYNAFFNFKYPTVGGTVDVHYYLPTKQWVCRVFNDAPPGANSYMLQNAVHGRYTHRNTSVAAGYGYWRVGIGYSPCC